MSKYHIYGIGAALVDTEIEVTDDDLNTSNIDKGVMTLVDEARQHELMDLLSDHLVASKRASGGSAANTVIAASHFGAKNFYSCKVANDENGWFYLDDIKQAGVDTPHHSGQAEGITGKCLVMITPDAERTMNTFLGISETLSIQDIDLEALKQSEYAYIEGYLVSSATGRAAAIELRKQAQRHGVKTAFSLSDPAMVQFFRDGLIEMIGDKVDLLFCNHDEALGFTQTDNLDDAMAALLEYTEAFVVTLGEKGAIIYDGKRHIPIAGSPTKAIDTNGAGDMFAGAFLYGITHNLSYEDAGILASVSAAQVVSQYGPRLAPEDHKKLLDAVVFHEDE